MKQAVVVLFTLTTLSIIAACNEKSTTDGATGIEVTDSQLYQLMLNSPKAAFYKNSADTIPGNSGGAHPGNVLVWYNEKAKDQLDANGKVKSSASFQDSSLIVKEIFNNNTRSAIAVLFKLRSASNAGANGWVWSEMDGTGNPRISAKDKGSSCSGCHSAGSAYDYTRMNGAHP